MVEEELKTLTIENQKLKEENELLRQKVSEFEQERIEEDQNFYQMYIEMASGN